jgi:hypothetical protein
MQNFGTKANDTAGPSGQLSADEFNNLATELENAVTSAGLGLTGASVTQMAQSLFLHGVKAQTFQDSGAANAYVATPTSGASGVLLPSNYTPLPGTIIIFKAAFTNTTASTLNIGQTTGTLIGSKPIRTQADVAIPANSLIAGQYVQLVYNPAFNAGGGAWELLPWATSGGKLLNVQVFSANGTYTPTAGMLNVIFEVQGGGGAGGGLTTPGAGNISLGAPGGCGSYAKGRFTAAQIGASQVVTVGAAGVAASNTAGTNGGTSSVGALITAPGGVGGSLLNNQAPGASNGNGSIAGTPTGANIAQSIGTCPNLSISSSATAAQAGAGAPSIFGNGGTPPILNGGGVPAQNYGAGGSGVVAGSGGTAQAGGAGKAGIIIAMEYA